MGGLGERKTEERRRVSVGIGSTKGREKAGTKRTTYHKIKPRRTVMTRQEVRGATAMEVEKQIREEICKSFDNDENVIEPNNIPVRNNAKSSSERRNKALEIIRIIRWKLMKSKDRDRLVVEDTLADAAESAEEESEKNKSRKGSLPTTTNKHAKDKSPLRYKLVCRVVEKIFEGKDRVMSQREIEHALNRLQVLSGNTKQFAQFHFYRLPKIKSVNERITQAELKQSMFKVLEIVDPPRPARFGNRRRINEIQMMSLMAFNLFRPFGRSEFDQDAFENLMNFALGDSIESFIYTEDAADAFGLYMKNRLSWELWLFYNGTKTLEEKYNEYMVHDTRENGVDCLKFACKIYKKSIMGSNGSQPITISDHLHEGIMNQMQRVPEILKSAGKYGTDYDDVIKEEVDNTNNLFQDIRFENLPTLEQQYSKFLQWFREGFWESFEEYKNVARGSPDETALSALCGLIEEHDFLYHALGKLADTMHELLVYAQKLPRTAEEENPPPF